MARKTDKTTKQTKNRKELLEKMKGCGVDTDKMSEDECIISLAMFEMSVCGKSIKISDEDKQILQTKVEFFFEGLNDNDPEKLRQEALSNQESAAVLMRQNVILYGAIANLMERMALRSCNKFGMASAHLTAIAGTSSGSKTPSGEEGKAEAAEEEKQDTENPEGHGNPPEGKKRPKRNKGCMDKQVQGLPVKELHLPFTQEMLEKLGVNDYRKFNDGNCDCIGKIVFEPAKLYFLQVIFDKIVDKVTGKIYSAKPFYPPVPEFEKSRLDLDTNAEWFIERYIQCQPGNQIAKNFKLLGLNIERQKIYTAIDARTTDTYRWIWARQLQLICHRHANQCDETYASDLSFKGQKKYMWQVRTSELSTGPQIIVFIYGPSREEKVLEEKIFKHFIENFHEGDPPMWIICDAYEAYRTLERRYPGMFIIVACTSHVRGKFIDVLKSIAGFKMWDEEKKNESAAYQAVCRLKAIFEKERKLRDFDPQRRKDARNQTMAELLDEFFDWLDTFEAGVTHLKGGLLDKAINYAKNNEAYLRRYLENGEIPIQNNAAERSHIHFAKARHGFKQFGSTRGAENGAICFSIALTLIENHVNPTRYIKYILSKTPALLKEHGIDPKMKIANEDLVNMCLDFLDVLMPWSPEYQACEEAEKEAESKREINEKNITGNISLAYCAL